MTLALILVLACTALAMLLGLLLIPYLKGPGYVLYGLSMIGIVCAILMGLHALLPVTENVPPVIQALAGVLFNGVLFSTVYLTGALFSRRLARKKRDP